MSSTIMEDAVYLLNSLLLGEDPTVEDFILLVGTCVAFIAFILWCCFPVAPKDSPGYRRADSAYLNWNNHAHCILNVVCVKDCLGLFSSLYVFLTSFVNFNWPAWFMFSSFMVSVINFIWADQPIISQERRIICSRILELVCSTVTVSDVPYVIFIL